MAGVGLLFVSMQKNVTKPLEPTGTEGGDTVSVAQFACGESTGTTGVFCRMITTAVTTAVGRAKPLKNASRFFFRKKFERPQPKPPGIGKGLKGKNPPPGPKVRS